MVIFHGYVSLPEGINLALRRVRRTVPVPSRWPSRNPCWNLQESLQLSRTKNSLMPSEVQLNLADLAGPSSQNLPKSPKTAWWLTYPPEKYESQWEGLYIPYNYEMENNIHVFLWGHRCRPWVSQNEININKYKKSLKPPDFETCWNHHLFPPFSTCRLAKPPITSPEKPLHHVTKHAAQLGQARSNLPVQGADEMVEQAPKHADNGETLMVSSTEMGYEWDKKLGYTYEILRP